MSLKIYRCDLIFVVQNTSSLFMQFSKVEQRSIPSLSNGCDCFAFPQVQTAKTGGGLVCDVYFYII